ncbi:MAG TPA: sigma-54 dependent transcriptional regulator [Gemmataceae bacterium]|nr:sigma-54 dependent transcriptional regulator [Gemmataceae bacterium]
MASDRIDSVPVSQAELAELRALAAENATLRQRLADLQARLDREVPYLRQEIKHERDLRTLTGSSPAMKGVRNAIQQVARTDSTVLITGETGTGKELVARAIHQLSPRRDHLLVTVNCAALNANIIASELFGHEQGAFTGASKRRLGRFESAHQGTIFLNEIAEIPAETQVMLLRVLQERVIERVGGNAPIGVDVRIIAATHQDLAEAVRQGAFRADLFYRLNVFPIPVPPLRERKADIPDLIQHFLHLFNRRMNKHVECVDDRTLQRLVEYHWPGNVRELENLIERAMIVSAGHVLTVEPTWLRATSEPKPNSGGLHDVERQTIVAALERCRGKIYGPSGAAALLGLKPTTLYGKLRKHGISKNSK